MDTSKICEVSLLCSDYYIRAQLIKRGKSCCEQKNYSTKGNAGIEDTANSQVFTAEYKVCKPYNYGRFSGNEFSNPKNIRRLFY